jgi:hypothetical protein
MQAAAQAHIARSLFGNIPQSVSMNQPLQVRMVMFWTQAMKAVQQAAQPPQDVKTCTYYCVECLNNAQKRPKSAQNRSTCC